VERAIAGRPRADTGDIEECVNAAEAVHARNHSVPNGWLIAHICDSEACFAKFCRQRTAFVHIDPNDEHRIFGGP
jgi:hypothetical protein